MDLPWYPIRVLVSDMLFAPLFGVKRLRFAAPFAQGPLIDPAPGSPCQCCRPAYQRDRLALRESDPLRSVANVAELLIEHFQTKVGNSVIQGRETERAPRGKCLAI